MGRGKGGEKYNVPVYSAHAMHKTPGDRKTREDLGFYDGWGDGGGAAREADRTGKTRGFIQNISLAIYNFFHCFLNNNTFQISSLFMRDIHANIS